MPRHRNELRILDLSDEHLGAVFKAALGICGFSYAEYAEFGGWSEQQVKHWATGRRGIPPFAWEPLSRLYNQIIEVSEAALDALDPEEVNDASLRLLAEDCSGEPLPTEGAINAVMAMYALAKMDG